MTQPAATLYATDPATRFFLIPDGVTLPSGPLVLRSLRGAVLRLDPVVADVYEVPEAEAQEIAGRSARALAEGLGAALRGATSLLGEVGRIQAGVAAAKQAPPDPKAAGLVAEALGVTTEQLHHDPAAVRVGLTQALGRLAADARALVAPPDPAQAAAAQARLDRLVQALDKEGLADIATPVAQLPDRLKEALSDPSLEEGLRVASARLREVADDLRRQRQG